MATIYRPSVCRQTTDGHIHYDVVLIIPPLPDSTNEDLLRQLANKVGGQTAGQVITILLEKRETGVDLDLYGVNYIKTQILPDHQICHKGEVESPAVDWDAWLFIPQPVTQPLPPSNVKVGRIKHS